MPTAVSDTHTTVDDFVNDLARLLGSSRGAEDLAQALLERLASRWPCRALALMAPAGTASQSPRVWLRGLSVVVPAELADAASAWSAFSGRCAGSDRRAFLWQPVPAPDGCTPGCLALLKATSESFDAAERDALASIARMTGPVFTQIRRSQSLRKLLDEQAVERQTRETSLACLNRVLSLLAQGPLERTFPLVAAELRRLVSFDWVGVFAWADTGEARELCAVDGFGAPQPRLRPAEGDDLLFHTVRRQMMTVRWDDLGSGDEPDDLARLRERGYGSAIVEPLRMRGRSLGILAFAHRSTHAFRSLDIHNLVPVLAHLATALAQSEEFRNAEGDRRAWERTFDTFPEGMLVLDEENHLLRLNAAMRRILHVTETEVRGRSLGEVAPEAEVPLTDGARVRRAGHEYLVSRFSIEGTDDPGGEPRNLVVLREVPAFRPSDEDLVQGEKLSLLGQLMAGIAHELNNPLASVIGYASLLRRQSTDEAVLRQIAAIDEGAIRCREIVRGLLGFARKHASERAPVVMLEMIQRTLALLRYQMRVNNVSVEVLIPADFPTVEADEYQLQQVFLNLIVNAYQAVVDARGSGHVWVRGLRRPGEVEVRVEDDGPGLAPSVRQRLFQPFVTTKAVGKGTGLGLSITRQIVEGHGGRIEAFDRGGGGTVFTICLPQASTPSAKASPTQDTAVLSPAPALPPARVLIVDDDAGIRDLVHGLLADAGARPVAVSTGREAIAALEAEPFDVVFSDVRMPDLDGRALFRWIQTHRPALASKVIFSTGDTVSDVSGGFLREARVVCVPKPFDVGDVLRAVASAIAGARTGN
ncbi:MAG: response regulator [Planctomycetes bacterium]|nr:response regulator [Planctomycetota bacterium]